MTRPAGLAAASIALAALCACGQGETAPNSEVTAAAEPAPAAPSKLKEIETPGAAKDAAAAYRTDMTEISVAAKGDPSGEDQLEHMVRMKAGDHLVCSWEVLDGGDFWHEFHGHTDDAVTFYKKADGTKHEGALIAPFDGIHGWYFENRSDRPVIVRLRTSGFYEREAKE